MGIGRHIFRAVLLSIFVPLIYIVVISWDTRIAWQGNLLFCVINAMRLSGNLVIGNEPIGDLEAVRLGRIQYNSGIRPLDHSALANATDLLVPVSDGRQLLVRLYYPKTSESVAGSKLPLVVFFHGGGHVYGSVDGHDHLTVQLARWSECIVASVDYPLAPDYRFPVPALDSVLATKWLLANAAQYGFDLSRVAVAGDSAGGNIAAVVAQQLTLAGVSLRAQLLVYPMCDIVGTLTASLPRELDTGLLSGKSMHYFALQYLPQPSLSLARDPLCSPTFASPELLRKLPPAIIIAAEIDVLTPEGLAYAHKLSAAGVEVLYRMYLGTFHGFWGFPGMPNGDVAMQESAVALRRFLVA